MKHAGSGSRVEMTQEKYGACRNGVRKAKATQSWVWCRHVEGEKGFYMSSKGKTKENAPAAEWTQSLVTKDMGKAEVLNVFFCLSKARNTCLQEPETPATRGKVWSNEDFLSGDWRGWGTPKMDTHRYMGPDRRQKKHAEGTGWCPLKTTLKIVFKKSQRLWEVPDDWKKARWTPISKLQEGQEGGSRELQAGQPHLDPTWTQENTFLLPWGWFNTATACTETL